MKSTRMGALAPLWIGALTGFGGTALAVTQPIAPAPGMPGTPASDVAAFVRVNLAKHELYVGETLPVDIEVGTHDGIVTAMNGPPTLGGDAFILEPLTSEPQRTAETIDGESFTVFTWHSTLAAAKPGKLSLTVISPLTVRVRAPAQSARRFFDEPGEFFNDPNFRGLFGDTQKDITVASRPDEFDVLALPARNRPATFTGAVGQFKVASEIDADEVTVGDPVTLRLKVAGTGSFDRVDTSMLHDPEHWKTYHPTARIKRDEQGGAQGEKVFEQPLIATTPGEQRVPSMSFSWFDPATRRYETAHTAPLTVKVAPAAREAAVTRSASASADTGVSPGSPGDKAAGVALRPDHVDSREPLGSLTPHYTESAYIAAPCILVALLSGTLLWLRRRDDVADEDESLVMDRLLEVMHDASVSRDATRFFKAARAALQRAFAPRWQLHPESITVDDVEARLGAGSDMVRVFRLADESDYAGETIESVDLQHWKHLVLEKILGPAAAVA